MDAPFKWSAAPSRSIWGRDMMVADVEIDRDSTVILYADRNDLEKVAEALRKALAETP